jgi:hypothetical protein
MSDGGKKRKKKEKEAGRKRKKEGGEIKVPMKFYYFVLYVG